MLTIKHNDSRLGKEKLAVERVIALTGEPVIVAIVSIFALFILSETIYMPSCLSY